MNISWEGLFKNKMKILIVSTDYNSGGAGRAAYRLHKALLSQGVDSLMLTYQKSDDKTVIGFKTKKDKLIAKISQTLDNISLIFYKNRTKTPFSPALLCISDIRYKIKEIKPDIIHLHWICGGMINIADIGKLESNVVWNFQDMWPFTGGCHYDEDCGKYQNICEDCKVLKSGKKRDLSRRVFKKKITSFSKIKSLTAIGVSEWISECARKSTLFKTRDVKTYPNCIDTDLFKKIDKNLARDFFKIPKDKKVILFGAMNPLADPRKGGKELLDALNFINIEDAVFVIAGINKPKILPKLKYQVYFIPPLRDEISLPLMYNTGDVMIVPSLQENLANSIIESLSCGVPVVAFDIGGNKDMIDHMNNGYLAKAFDIRDLANGIEWILKNPDYNKLSINAREKALKKFDSTVVAKQYIKLYKNILRDKNDTF